MSSGSKVVSQVGGSTLSARSAPAAPPSPPDNTTVPLVSSSAYRHVETRIGGDEGAAEGVEKIKAMAGPNAVSSTSSGKKTEILTSLHILADRAEIGKGEDEVLERMGALAISNSRIPLPIELIEYILSFIPHESLQSTALSLINSIPRLQLSPSILWRFLYFTRNGQLHQADRIRLDLDDDLINKATRSITSVVWQEDSRHIINFFKYHNSLKSIRLHVGPRMEPADLLAIFQSPDWTASVESITLRFSPYSTRPDYSRFLKGIYFDSTPLAISSWPLPSSLRRIAFIQDLPPRHGILPKETPAWGLRPTGNEAEGEFVAPVRRLELPVEKLDFAQPIIFFHLACMTALAHSSVGINLTHLTLRLPCRSLLPALTTFETLSLSPPFPSLLHLDLSTTHFPASDSDRLPLLLRIYTKLQHLVLDRCTGLISLSEINEDVSPTGMDTAAETMRWLGKCCANQRSSRTDEWTRAWKRIVKSRPTPASPIAAMVVSSVVGGGRGVRKDKEENKSMQIGSISPVPVLVKELLILSSPPTLLSLCLGLHTLSSSLSSHWRTNFYKGFEDATAKRSGKMQEGLERYRKWINKSRLEELGERRCVVEREGWALIKEEVQGWREEGEGEKGCEEDRVFDLFCKERGLVVITPSSALLILSHHHSHPCPILCTTPDLSNTPGIPHHTPDDEYRTPAERNERERELRLVEEGEKSEWRRKVGEHVAGCGHLCMREVEEEMD